MRVGEEIKMRRTIGATCPLLIAGSFSNAQAANGKPPLVQITKAADALGDEFFFNSQACMGYRIKRS
jgi:hypothetical protein